MRLTAHRVLSGFSDVRDYEPLVDITWSEVAECLDAEERWLDRAASGQDAKAFDQMLFTAAEEEAGGDFDYLFRYIDVGVAGLVFVLAAAGYATCYSCRGHPGLATNRVPQVRFGTEPARLEKLVPYVEGADCGLTMDEEGLVTVYAATVPDLHRLARLIANNRQVFDSMEPPPWRAQVLEALESNGESGEI